MTLFITEKAARKAGGNAVQRRLADSYKVRPATRLSADRSREVGYAVTLNKAGRKPWMLAMFAEAYQNETIRYG